MRASTVAISIATLPARARALDMGRLAAVFGGRGWWRRVWRRLDSLPAALGKVADRITVALRSRHRRAARQLADWSCQGVFRSFWLAFRF